MKAPRFAHNKTEAAKLAGMSRTLLYRLMRLPGFPAPRADGRWSVAEIRRFARNSSARLEAPSERHQLEMELLRKRIHKVDLEISDLDNSRTEEIASKITGECKQAIDTLNGQLQAMPSQLSGIFSALDGPMPIYTRFKAELHQRFKAAYDKVRKIEHASRRKGNLIPVNRANGNGAVALNGSNRV